MAVVPVRIDTAGNPSPSVQRQRATSRAGFRRANISRRRADCEIQQDDIDKLMSFRIAGKKRVWCIQDRNIMRVLWWDPQHEICRVPKAYLIEPRGGADLVLAESLPPEHLLPRGAVIAFRSYHYCRWTVIFGTIIAGLPHFGQPPATSTVMLSAAIKSILW